MTRSKPATRKRELDSFTLRSVYINLEARAEHFRHAHEQKGHGPRHHFLHRAAELEYIAGELRDLAVYGAAKPSRQPRKTRKP